ncbi:hypothetical protein C7S18_21875 [Ahniella affigens]|uniref:Uncharacterized protein n=1 Tax=Ahniella affigens TaxID=2021234 RepID=A0A2P1PXV3_9GAMM|nr:hypothetical protein C7S18_21875 [Ahniella affigens]
MTLAFGPCKWPECADESAVRSACRSSAHTERKNRCRKWLRERRSRSDVRRVSGMQTGQRMASKIVAALRLRRGSSILARFAGDHCGRDTAICAAQAMPRIEHACTGWWWCVMLVLGRKSVDAAHTSCVIDATQLHFFESQNTKRVDSQAHND